MALNLRLPTFNVGGLLHGSAGIINAVIMVATVAAIIFFLVSYLGYNKNVFLYRKTGSKWIIYKDKGKFIKKNDVYGLHLWGKKLFLPVPKPEQVHLIHNGIFGFKEVIHYEWKSDMQLVPLELKIINIAIKSPWIKKFTANDLALIKKYQGGFREVKLPEEELAQFEPIPTEINMWANQEAKRKIENYRKLNFFEKYGQLIGMALLMAGFFLTVILVLDKFSVLQGVASSLSQAADTLAKTSCQQVVSGPPA